VEEDEAPLQVETQKKKNLAANPLTRKARHIQVIDGHLIYSALHC
jgi:hypothetical protein